MADDFIGSLKADWDRQTAEATVVRLRRRRWTTHVLLAGDILGAVALIACGLGFGVGAVRLRDPLFGLSAAAMLLFALPLVLVGLRTRWRSLGWDDRTAEGVLTSSLGRLQATERIVRLSRAGAYTLLVLAAAAWTGAAAGLVRQPASVLGAITGAWIAAGVVWLFWVRWRLARIGRERAACETLLRQFEEA
jgi:hypothetical protein